MPASFPPRGLVGWDDELKTYVDTVAAEEAAEAAAGVVASATSAATAAGTAAGTTAGTAAGAAAAAPAVTAAQNAEAAAELAASQAASSAALAQDAAVNASEIALGDADAALAGAIENPASDTFSALSASIVESVQDETSAVSEAIVDLVMPATFVRSDAPLPIRATCIGTSIYANGLRTAKAVVVDVAQSWSAANMDKYMQGGGGASWFTWMALLSPGGSILPTYNAAESGSTLTQQAARFQTELLTKSPGMVFLGDATNDINTGVSDDTIRGLITQQIGWALDAGLTPSRIVLVATIRRNDSTAKNDRVKVHNKWLRTYAFANGYTYIDPFAVLIDPATGGLNTTYAPDGLHPNTAGGKLAGQRALTDLATALAGHAVDAAHAPFIMQAADAGNLLTNGDFSADVNADGKADSWGVNGTPSVLTDARLTYGKKQRMVVTGNGQVIQQGITVGGGSVSVGDRVALSGLIEVSAAAGSLQYNFGLYTVGQTGIWASNPIGYGGGSGGGPVGVDMPLAPFYCELTIPTGATLLRAEAKAFTGTGTIDVAQWCMHNLTTGSPLLPA